MTSRESLAPRGGVVAPRAEHPEEVGGEVSARVTAAYDTVAVAYADLNAVMPDALVGLGQRALERAGVGARVLDVGCGAGRDMVWFEAQKGNGARVVGVDRSAGMLTLARRHVRGGLARMDMRALGFSAATFDIVWCIAALLHVPKANAPLALVEMRRVLRPSGVLALSLQVGSGEGWESGPYPGVSRFFARYTLAEVDALLARAAFSILQRGVDEAGGRRWLSILAI